MIVLRARGISGGCHDNIGLLVHDSQKMFREDSDLRTYKRRDYRLMVLRVVGKDVDELEWYGGIATCRETSAPSFRILELCLKTRTGDGGVLMI